MTLGISLFLIAVGAILAFAVTGTVRGLDLYAAGLILLGVGFVGLLLSLLVFGKRSEEV